MFDRLSFPSYQDLYAFNRRTASKLLICVYVKYTELSFITYEMKCNIPCGCHTVIDLRFTIMFWQRCPQTE